jgi:hypothetical protein
MTDMHGIPSVHSTTLDAITSMVGIHTIVRNLLCEVSGSHALTVEAVHAYVKSIYFIETTRPCIPEGCNINS